MTSGWSAVGAVMVNGVRLAYRESGDPQAPPVVLLHGSGSGTHTWERFAAQLVSEGHRAIAVDLRGHGASGRPGHYPLVSLRDDLLGLLEALDLRETVLVGHSVGGYAALAAALEAPGRIARLVLEDLAAPPRRAERMTGVNPVSLVSAVAGIVTGSRTYDVRALVSLLRQLTRPDAAWWERLGEVRRPTLLLSGGATSCIPPRRLAEATAAIPDARLTTIPVGHRVHSLAPDEFAAEVLAFLAEPSFAAA